MNVKMIASDLDGTFLNPQGYVSDLNKQAVERAIDAGLQVLFATGRPPSWLAVLEELALPHSMVIASNGAVLYDVATGEVLQRHALPTDVVLEVAHQVREALPGVSFGVQREHDFGHEPGYFIREQLQAISSHVDVTTHARLRQRMIEGDLAELVTAEPFVKLLVKHPEATATAISELVQRFAGGRLTVTYSMGDGHGLVEVSAPGVTKATALADYCAQLNIDPADVAAFGDQPNDLAMLRWSGHPHLMANHDSRMADLGFPVIGSNADDAVGRTILSWLT